MPKRRSATLRKGIAEKDDGVVVGFTSTQFDKVLEWVLSCEYTARPLEPELLVNVWRDIIIEMKKMMEGK